MLSIPGWCPGYGNYSDYCLKDSRYSVWAIGARGGGVGIWFCGLGFRVEDSRFSGFRVFGFQVHVYTGSSLPVLGPRNSMAPSTAASSQPSSVSGTQQLPVDTGSVG